MDLEEDEQEPAQELIAEEPEGNNEDPPPAADAVPQQINQDFHHVVTRTCQVFKRQMTAYLTHQQLYATQPYRFSLHFQYFQSYSLKFHLFQQLCLHSTISHHHSLQHYSRQPTFILDYSETS